MAEPVYSYAPGSALAVCGTRVAALVDLPPDAGLVLGLYDLVGDPTAGLDEVLELLVSPGLRAVEHFALAEYTDEGLRTVVRGRYRTRAGAQTVEGRGLWADRILQADGYLLLDPEAPDAGVLPLTTGGVVLAGRLQRRSGDAPVTPVVAPPMQSPAEPEWNPIAPSASGPAVVPVPAERPAGLVRSGNQPDEFDGPPGRASEPAGRTSGTPSGSNLEVPDASGHAMPTPFTSSSADPPAPALSPPNEPDQRPSFIESLPWSSAAAQAGPLTPNLAADGDARSAASGPTISDEHPDAGVQNVVAARCPAGHLSPAYAGTCRTCGRPLPPQQPVEVPRPPLGVLRLSNGDTVLLDRGCILGRNPRVPIGYSGEQPNLVKLIDPDKDISSQHLEVLLDYWHVAVKDLGSTNGTQVAPPGAHPVRLRPNDAVMIEPGTEVILAGVFSFTFEVPEGP